MHARIPLISVIKLRLCSAIAIAPTFNVQTHGHHFPVAQQWAVAIRVYQLWGRFTSIYAHPLVIRN